jgi:hypothetical protein
MDDKLNKIYDYLSSQNVENLPSDYNGFTTLMKDDAKAQKVHSFLLSQNIENVDADFNVFKDYVGVKKKDSLLDFVTQGQKDIPFLGQSGLNITKSPNSSIPQQPSPSKDSGSYVGDLFERIGAGAIDIATSAPKQMTFAQRILDVPRKIVQKELSLLGLSEEKAQKISNNIPFIKPTMINDAVNISKAVWDKIEKTEDFQNLEQKATDLRESSARYDQTMIDYLKKKEYNKAIGVSFLGAAESLPITLMAMAGGPIGLAEIGMYSASAQYDELKDMPMNEMQKVSNALLNGGLEIATEKLGSANYGKLIKSLYKTAGKEVAEETVKKGLKTWLVNMWKKAGIYTAPVGEGLEEAVNKFGSNITAVVTGEDPERPLDYNVANAAGSGFASGTVFTTVGMPGQIRQQRAEEAKVKAKEAEKKTKVETTDKGIAVTEVGPLTLSKDELKQMESPVVEEAMAVEEATTTDKGTAVTEVGALKVPQEVTDQKAQENIIKPQKTPYVEINSENISELEKNHLDLLNKENVTTERVALDKENIDITKQYINGKAEGKNVYGVPSELPESYGRISEIKSEGEGGDGRTLQEVYDGRRGGNESPRVTTEEQVTNQTAPNGEKSNLSTENHAYVRTDDFKKRFGDWQNGKGSLVLDANGEPMLVYSGQSKLFINGVEPNNAGVKKIHFTGDKGLAARYAWVRKKQPVVYKGFLNITDPNEIGKFHENQQEFLITDKAQFIPMGIEDAMDLVKPKTEVTQTPTTTAPVTEDVSQIKQENATETGESTNLLLKDESKSTLLQEEAEKDNSTGLAQREITDENKPSLTETNIKAHIDKGWGSDSFVRSEIKRFNDLFTSKAEESAIGAIIPKIVSVKVDSPINYGDKAKYHQDAKYKWSVTFDDGSIYNMGADQAMGNPYSAMMQAWLNQFHSINKSDQYANSVFGRKEALTPMDLYNYNPFNVAPKSTLSVKESVSDNKVEEEPVITLQNEANQPLSQESGSNVPPTPNKPEIIEETVEKPETRIREIGAKVIASANVEQDVKDALLEHGIDYIPRGRKFTQTELKELVDIFSTVENGLDKLAEKVYDLKNDIKGDTRVTLNVYIANQYSKLLDASTDTKTREKYRNKVADAYIFGQEFATEAGQTVEALKQWRELLSRDPESIIAIRKRQQTKNNEFALQGMAGDIKSAKEIIESIVNTDEFKQILETEVNKEIDKIADKKYGEADKKKINDFFDGLLVKNDKAFDATIGIPIAVYNGAVLTIKKAVLAGVDITNAIKQAVTYVDEWYKKNYAEGKITSPEWNKDDYVAQMNSHLKPLTKKVKKVKYKLPKNVEDKLVDKIYSKMSNATKPQLRRLVKEYITTLETEGVINEQRFKDLFARAIGLDVLTPQNEQKIREIAQSLKHNTKVAEKLVNKFKELVSETDNTKIKQLEEDIKGLKEENKKAKFQAQKAAIKLAGLMTDKSTLGSVIHSLIQANLLTPISLLSNVVGNTVFLPVRHVSYMTASALDFMVSKIAETYTPLLKTDWVKASPRVRRLIESLPTPSREYNYWAATKGYWYGIPKGLEEGLRQMWTGTLPEDQYQNYISQGLKPWEAALRFRDQVTGKEQIAFDTALANFLEALPTTYMGEAFFRTLNLGDKPYRRAAERSRLEEIASLKGLKGNQRDAFINNPDPDTVEESRKAGDVAVYQQDTVVSEMFSWLNKRVNRIAAEKATKRTSVIVSTMAALLKATQAPYVKTPVNLIGEAIDYSIPILSLGRAVAYAKQGNKRKSYEYFGKTVVGYMMMSMAFFLLKEGLLTPPPDDDDKIRQAQLDAKPGYSLNLDALWRRINPFDNAKGNSEWKEKDTVMNIQRLGVFSMILMGISKAYAQFPPDELEKDLNLIEKSLYSVKMIPAEIGASLDQSFLSGTASGIKAFTEGGPAFDSWAISTSKALSAVIYPNTLAQISQVFFDDNYIREVRDMYSRDEKFKRQIINTFKDRTFMGKQLPAKVTLWGEKVDRVPEGESWAHVMFDVTKSVEYQKSSFGVRMFEFYERYKFINETDAKRILPSIPNATNTVGWDARNMTSKEVEAFQINVGQRRKSYVENLMNSEEWALMADEDKIVELERIYRTQASKVKASMFMLDVIKAEPKVFNFLEENDLIPIPSTSVVITYRKNKIKLDPEQTANYYENVQRYFIERMSALSDTEVGAGEKSRDKLIDRVNGYWNRAREMADKDWVISQNK